MGIWYNIHKDKRPAPGQVVLISVKGVNYTATFDEESSTFRSLSDSGEEIRFSINAGTIYWTDLSTPGYQVG